MMNSMDTERGGEIAAGQDEVPAPSLRQAVNELPKRGLQFGYCLSKNASGGQRITET
jgi:hypothetical protein